MATDRPRSPSATALVETALVRLATAAGDHALDLVVVGGLVPAVIAATAATRHHGTTDLDLLVEVGLVYDDDDIDLTWLEPALDAAGFRPTTGWRWEWADAPVRLDLLCDRDGSAPGEISLPRCPRASALNLRGPRAARCDAAPRTIAVPGGSVTMRFAGLGGYLLSKAAAARTRAFDRDFYDFYFVALHNDAGGPAAAAAAMRRVPCASVLASFTPELRLVLRAALTGERTGAHAYAAEMRLTGDDTPYDTLVEDAATAAHVIAGALDLDVS